MGQVGVRSASRRGRETGRHRSGKRAEQRRVSEPDAALGDPAALVHAPDAAAQGVRKAVAAQLFRKLASATDLAPGKVRAQLIPDSTWKRAGEVLGPSASQTVSRLANALFLAERIWQNQAEAIGFLLRPHVELGRASPYSLLNTESGGRRVENLLAALQYGFPV
jgi:putative toxin-antitoxin system antitoxin component (TIGR02293 family)